LPFTRDAFWYAVHEDLPDTTWKEKKELIFEPEVWNRQAIGAGLMMFGTAMLIPGPFDLVAAGAGAVVFGGPHGAAMGLAIYNITAVGLIIVGFLMFEEYI